METLVIKPKNRRDSQKIREFAEKMGAEQRTYTEDEMEDIGMGVLLREVDMKSSKTVPREDIMRILDAE